MASATKRQVFNVPDELKSVNLVGIGSAGEMKRVYFSSNFKLRDEPSSADREKVMSELVVYILDATDYSDEGKACIMNAIMNHIPIVATPRASRSDFLWAIKPTVEANGGIMELAAAKADLRLRVLAITKAATIRHWSVCTTDSRLRHPTFYPSFNTAKARILGPHSETESERLGALPGVFHATQFLRAESGKLDAEKTRELFDFTRKEIASYLGVTAEAIRVNSDSDSIQPKLAVFERIARLLVLNPKHDDFRRWLHAPNSEFNETSPLSVISGSGGPESVADLVEDIITNRGR